jgi:hypothetical protein
MTHHKPKTRFLIFATIIFAVILFFHPGRPVPSHLNDVCQIFQARPHWYWAAQKAHSKWRVPIGTQMAIIFKESHFHPAARPPRKKWLGLVPWSRPTSAEGYAQAVNQTWHLYLRETHQRSASRQDFSKAVDFIGWYLHRIHQHLGIAIKDVKHLYLAYHEGSGAYQKGSYIKQPHLIKIAQKVKNRADRYQRQLARCQHRLPIQRWYNKLF